MHLIPDLKEFIELLNSECVRYVVIGGWAYNRYAEPRFTGDIDFFVSTDSDNQAKLRIVLTKFGFGQMLPPGNLFEKQILMLGRPPNRIDIASDISGVKFDEVWACREVGTLDGLPVSFISIEHLIKNKVAAGRDKDLLDAKKLQEFLDAS